jgi:enamine deaminase RidA (YjgF/YER057c/UK114 family)
MSGNGKRRQWRPAEKLRIVRGTIDSPRAARCADVLFSPGLGQGCEVNNEGSIKPTVREVTLMPTTSRPVRGLWLLLAAIHPAVAQEHTLRRIAPDAASGTAGAVVVDGSTALAHTPMILPLDQAGRVVSDGRPDEQSAAVLDRLEKALDALQSGLDRLVKIDVYAARPDVIPLFRATLARRLAGKPGPAISVVVGALADPAALVAVDAVAATTTPTGGGVVVRVQSPALAGQSMGNTVAVLPAGCRVFVSGQANPGADMAQATRNTLEGLDRTLSHLALDRTHVVRAKAFLGPIAAASEVQREVAAFFGDAVPPLTLVEWRSEVPIEIELVAAAGSARAARPVEYITPPGPEAIAGLQPRGPGQPG